MQDTKANLSMWNPFKDLIIRVCVLNSAGCGPWSDLFLLEAQEVMGECPLFSSFTSGKKSEILGLLFFLSLFPSVLTTYWDTWAYTTAHFVKETRNSIIFKELV